MENKRKVWGAMILVSLCLLVFSSCSKKDEVAAPSIRLYQLGSHDEPESKIFFLNEYCHFEADIQAPGKVARIEVVIQQVSGYATYSSSTVYTGDYVGLQEIQAFHDHPIVPEGQAVGDYVFKLIVTDQLGQVSSVVSDLKVEAGNGTGGGHVHEP